ncbi:MAG: tetratricopeptide repeat protein [Chloroflexi bacterium]|nr:tetratricopeptide repeat protein [Chloroflexota bacterium]
MTARNLPRQRTPFIGRENELAQIKGLLADPACRLLSLIGPGGIGKTRLAIEVAQQSSCSDGVYFVALQSLSLSEYLVPAIAESIGFQFHQSDDLKQQLLDHLRGQQLLLVLDNFEHRLADADLVSEILACASGVKVITTSREVLNLREEWVYQVPAMRFPADDNVEGGEDYSAVQLFVQCARRVRTDFAWDKERAGVNRICRLVGGMPLGIELASAWVRVLSCHEIAVEIERSLDILETRARNVPPRHRNIRAVYEPTWSRLPATEQAVFMRLSVFRGGFRREAAKAVANASLHTLSALVDKSLVQHESDGRYDLHELLRQYAAEQLNLAGQADATHAAHCAYYGDFLCERERDLKGRRQLEALDEIDVEFDNVRAAWLWAVEHKRAETIQCAIHSLRMFCEWRSRFQEGEYLFRQAQEAFAPAGTSRPEPIWGRLTACRAWLLVIGEFVLPADMPAQIEQCLTIAQANHDRESVAFCRLVMGIVLATQKNDVARGLAYLDDSLSFYREINDRFFMGAILNWIGHLKTSLPDALPLLQQSLAINQEAGALDGTAWVLSGIGFTKLAMGQPSQAISCFEESLAIQRTRRDRKGIVLNTFYLSKAAFFAGQFEKAETLAQEARKLAADYSIYSGKGTLALLALLSAIRTEDYARARQLCAEALTMHETLLDWGFWLDVNMGLAILAYIEGNLKAAREHYHIMLSIATPRRGAQLITMCLPVGALILAHTSEQERAVELLGLAFTQPDSQNGWMENWPLLTRLRAQLEAEMGPITYTAAWERGAGLDLYRMKIRPKR